MLLYTINQYFFISRHMVIKLYIQYVSQPSRAVLALCIIGNIPYEVVEVNIMTGENHSQSFKKINPMKRVPAIFDTDNNFALAQSHAILKYLCQKYKVVEQWFSLQDIVKQAKINQFLDFHHLNTRKCSYLSFHTLFAPFLKTGDPTFDSKFTYKVVINALRNFQKVYLQGNKFIGGDLPCIGDLIAFFDITMLQTLEFDYSAFPKIVKWIDEMKKIEGVCKANLNFEKSKEGLIQMYRNTKEQAKL